MAKALQLHLNDNVAVCTVAVKKGERVEIMRPDGTKSEVIAVTDNTYCNKIALFDIAKDEAVVKYGEVIGKASAAIARGALANDANIASQPRAYADEYILKTKEA